jgi:hypothetical protein
VRTLQSSSIVEVIPLAVGISLHMASTPIFQCLVSFIFHFHAFVTFHFDSVPLRRWGGEKDPRLSFLSVVGKAKNKVSLDPFSGDRGGGGGDVSYVGWPCLSHSRRILSRSPFDSNVIVRFDAFEVYFPVM